MVGKGLLNTVVLPDIVWLQLVIGFIANTV